MVDDVDCNLRQIDLGLAWHYKKHMKEQLLYDRLIYLLRMMLEVRRMDCGWMLMQLHLGWRKK